MREEDMTGPSRDLGKALQQAALATMRLQDCAAALDDRARAGAAARHARALLEDSVEYIDAYLDARGL